MGGPFDSVEVLVITMVSLFLYIFGLLIALGGAALAAVNDVRAYRIPNVASVLAIAGFVIAYSGIYLMPGAAMLFFHAPLAHVTAAVVMFVLTLAMFAGRLIGAGDAKFASALSLWLSVHPDLMMFVFYTSLIGGVMGLVTLALQRIKPFKTPTAGTWIAAAQEGQNRIPYGLALALGFVLTLAALGYFNITEIINVVENPE